MSIYVETFIRSDLDDVWRLTQSPDLHERWDLRFSGISYLPRPDPLQPQRFLYETRIGFGAKIRGEGESVGSYDAPSGERTSALKFWSDDPKSLIASGSGYWKYVPTSGGTQFFTSYDYAVRFGTFGKIFDALIFRPLLGWATAWSFDSLRLWIEKKVEPEISRRLALVHAVVRLAIAFVFVYQGLVPKLLFHAAAENGMVRALGVPAENVSAFVSAAGIAEVVFGLLMLYFWLSPWPFWLALAFMGGALVAVAASSPAQLTGAFNAVTLNVAVSALSLVGLLALRDVPSALRCRRTPVRLAS
jgi:uncharacterized membrane protein YphA (DoxX/SURF4 family)